MSTDPDRDPALAALWREHSTETPPPHVDAAILAAAHRATASAPHGRERWLGPRAWRWWMPLAAAAVIAVMFPLSPFRSTRYQRSDWISLAPTAAATSAPSSKTRMNACSNAGMFTTVAPAYLPDRPVTYFPASTSSSATSSSATRSNVSGSSTENVWSAMSRLIPYPFSISRCASSAASEPSNEPSPQTTITSSGMSVNRNSLLTSGSRSPAAIRVRFSIRPAFAEFAWPSPVSNWTLIGSGIARSLISPGMR